MNISNRYEMQIVLIFHLFDLQSVIGFDEEENVEGGEDIHNSSKIYFIFVSKANR